MTESNEINFLYAGISLRVKAAMLDGFILILSMMGVSFLFAEFESVPDQTRMIAFVLLFVFYDPLFTSFSGGTIGHKMMGLRVQQKEKPLKNINFLKAIIRFFLKAILGWISLLTVDSKKENQALHDMAVGSVVVCMK
ncbi:MAG: RDD family protein [Vicingaceae bacterium]